MTSWQEALPHREPHMFDAAVERLEAEGLTPEDVRLALGRGFTEDLLDPAKWSSHGGSWGVAALAQEIDAQAYYVRRQASAIRHAAIVELTKTHSIADIARRLGQSRQAISKVANGEPSFRDLTRRIVNELKDL